MEVKEVLTLTSFAGVILTAVGSWVLTKKQAADAEAVNDKQWLAIDKIKQWQSTHEKEAGDRRLELELKIAVLAGTVGKIDGKLESIEKKLDNLISEMKHGHS